MDSNKRTITGDTTRQPTTTDEAISKCQSLIDSHNNEARRLFSLIFVTTSFFLILVSSPLLLKMINSDNSNLLAGNKTNDHIEKLNHLQSISYHQYDSLITKAISYQNLLNANSKATLSEYKLIAEPQKQDASDYILYGVFILIFGVLTSLYRFHLKEISKQEHYLIGFQRIRIAGVNSTSKYDEEVKIALTSNAFSLEDGTSRKSNSLESPIPGHPSSDFATELLNKLLSKFDFVIKKESKSDGGLN